MELKALILAAGMGTRLKPLTDTQPKCLTEINGRPIIVNALEILSLNNIQETTIVIGYLGDKIKEIIGSSVNGMAIRYIENPIFAKTNTAYSLLLGLADIGRFNSIFILEGDVFFEADLLEAMMNSSEENLTAVEKYNPTLDGSFAELDNEGFVVDWVHKKHRTIDYIVETKYKTVNIHKLSNEFVKIYLDPVLSEQVNLFAGNVPLEDVMRKIVRSNKRLIKGIQTENYKWFEVDDENDLRIAESIFR